MGICTSTNNHVDPLDNIPDNIPKDSMKYKTFRCKVVDVYDGDTCTIIIYKGNNETNIDNRYFFKYKVRMYGYNTPELKPKKSDFDSEQQRQQEIKSAKLAKMALEEKILNKKLLITCKGRGKYGRLLGILRFPNDTTSINDWMVSSNYGKPYKI
jgi:endonuclease YncB( thermonuclease family)